MTLSIYPLVFYAASFVLLTTALLVILVRNPVHAILFLVLSFVASAVLWMLLQAEFLSLVLIFVYVGAVMTLFLFVVMMLNIDLSQKKTGLWFLPIAAFVMMLLVGMMIFVMSPQHYSEANQLLPASTSTNNTVDLGALLYTQYVYPFELAGVILLVAIIAAVSLAFHGRKANTLHQNMGQQLAANKQNRLKIIRDTKVAE